jgi:hypothetical protein
MTQTLTRELKQKIQETLDKYNIHQEALTAALAETVLSIPGIALRGEYVARVLSAEKRIEEFMGKDTK